jgi:predicted secreted protein
MKILSEKFNTASVKKGEQFAIELPSTSASSGYLWEFNVTKGEADVVGQCHVNHTPPRRPDPAMLSGIFERAVLEAKESGTVEVTAELRRPWEKGTPPAQTRVFRIDVE